MALYLDFCLHFRIGGKWPFHCSLDNLKVKGLQIGFPTSTSIIMKKMLRQLQITNLCFPFTVQITLDALDESVYVQQKKVIFTWTN